MPEAVLVSAVVVAQVPPIIQIIMNTILKLCSKPINLRIPQLDCRTSQTRRNPERSETLKEYLARVRKTNQLKNPEHSFKDRGTF